MIYQLAKHNVLTLNGQSQGILSVLVLGAGTDYALLLISRYREELHNYDSRVDAMAKAWRRAATAIGASASHRHPRPAVPGLRRAQLGPEPGAGVRHRDRLHRRA